MPLKFRCDRNSFLNAITNANRAVVKHSPMLAALTGVYLNLEDDALTITGSDLDLTVTVTTDVAGEDSGEAVIPARLLLDVVKAMPAGSLDVDVTQDKAMISASSTEFAIKVLSVQDWPQLPMISAGISEVSTDAEASENQGKDASGQDSDAADRNGSLSQAEYSETTGVREFRDALNQVVRSASTDETRPILTGVLMSSENKGIRLVSTDSYRLSLRDLPGSDLLGKEQQVLVPGRALRELQRMIHDSEEITMRLSERMAEFTVEKIRLTTRLIEGEFPKYRELIPETEDQPNVLIARRAKLLEAVRRVRLLAQDSTPVHIVLGGNSLEIRADTEAVGSASETIEAQYDGDKFSIGFNPEYLIDGLEVSDSEEVKLQLQDELKPALLSPVDDEGFLYLLMPVRVPSR